MLQHETETCAMDDEVNVKVEDGGSNMSTLANGANGVC